MKNRLKFIIIVLIILVVAVLIALPKLGSSGGNTNNTAAVNTELQVRAYIVAGEEIANNIQSSGTVLANEEVEIRSEVSGKITNIFLKEGTSVKKGDLLIKINDEELQAQLSRAKYRLKLLEDQEYRKNVLLEKEAISQEDYDVSLNELNVIKAEVELINAQISKTEIRSPFDGVIGLKYVSEGSFVTPSTIIASLQSINPLKIEFSIPEKYASSVAVGNPVKFKVTGDQNEYTAKIYAIEPKIDQVTRTVKIRALYNNLSNRIFPGSFAQVSLELMKIEDAMLIPSYALIPELKGQKVFLYKNGMVSPQNVETGIRTDQRVQITSGLQLQDTVIISGILQLRPGMPVSISEFN
jgi:membrane fusion protein (multidrug efflux system)